MLRGLAISGLQAWAYSIVVELIKSTTITPATIKNLFYVWIHYLRTRPEFCLDLDGELLSPVLIDNCTVVERYLCTLHLRIIIILQTSR